MSRTPLRSPRRARFLLLTGTAVLAVGLLAPAVPSAAADDGATSSADPEPASSSVDPSPAPSEEASPSPSADPSSTPTDESSSTSSEDASGTPTNEPAPTLTETPTDEPSDTTTDRRRRIHFRAASFNILGTQHTVHSDRYASGPRRARMAVRWLRHEHVSVLGMSEAQRDQMKVIVKHGFRSYPSYRRSYDTQTAQSVVWNPDRWKRVKARTFTIPFNYNQRREQPMVLLRNRATGRKLWVVSVHFTYGSSDRARWERRIGTRRTLANVRRLQRTPNPVLLTGDMNDHRRAFCKVEGGTALQAMQGGTHRRGSCNPPARMRIDWLFLARRFDSSRWRFADGRTVNRITDHSVAVTSVSW